MGATRLRYNWYNTTVVTTGLWLWGDGAGGGCIDILYSGCGSYQLRFGVIYTWQWQGWCQRITETQYATKMLSILGQMAPNFADQPDWKDNTRSEYGYEIWYETRLNMKKEIFSNPSTFYIYDIAPLINKPRLLFSCWPSCVNKSRNKCSLEGSPSGDQCCQISMNSLQRCKLYICVVQCPTYAHGHGTLYFTLYYILHLQPTFPVLCCIY